MHTSNIMEAHVYYPQESDAVAGIERSLSDAAKQLTTDRVAIIHLDITATLQELIGTNLASSIASLEKFLRSHPKISAVAMEHENFSLPSGVLTWTRMREYVWNDLAIRPVPPTLRAHLEKAVEVERLYAPRHLALNIDDPIELI